MQTQLTLFQIIHETSDVISLKFNPNPRFDFQAGQYLRYTIKDPNPDNRGNERYFSISSAPSEKFIQLTTRINRKHSSSFKNYLQNLKPNGTILAHGPMGSFSYLNPNQESVFIAGGIGITPFRSMLVDLDSQVINPKVTLLYANRNSEIPFKQLFDSLALKYSNLKVIYIVDSSEPNWTGETGKINPELIKKYVPNLQKPIFYLSGPKPLVESLGIILEEMGISKDHYQQDFFPGYEGI